VGKYNASLAIIIFALSVPLIQWLLPEIFTEWSLFLYILVSGLVINICTLYVVSRTLKNLFYQYFYLAFIIWFLSWILVYHLLAIDTRNPYGSFNLPYDRYPMKFYFLWMAPAIATVLLFPLLKIINSRIGQEIRVQKPETQFMQRTVAWVFFVFNLIYFFGNVNVEIPVLSYIGRVGHTTSLFFMFWIAYWNKRLGAIYYLTLLLMLSIAAVELLAGSRFGPLMTGLLFFMGYYASSSKATKWKLRIVAVIAFPLVISFVGYLEKVRMLIGRSGLEEVSIERIEKVRSAIDRLDEISRSFGNKESAFVAGVGRNINWVDMAVVTASDEKVPYRGTKNLQREIDNIISLTFFSGGSTTGAIRKATNEKYSLGLGTAPARRYGFSVNERTSVEWSVLSDGYSRGGFSIYLVYLCAFLILTNGIEFIIKTWNKNATEQKLLMCVFLDLIIKSNALPLYEITRAAILNAMFYLFIILMLRVWALMRGKAI